MEDQDPTLMLPKHVAPPQKGVTDSQMHNLFAVGEEAFATQPTSPPRGWEPPSVEMLQAALPQYEITALIARGGMGAVYRGQQRTLKRAVAVKVLPPDMQDGDLQFVERFKHEAQAMAQLSHPNIVAVFDAGEVRLGKTGSLGEAETGRGETTLLYFVMEFVEGTDVAQLIASEGRVEPKRAIQITTAVCEALAFAHEEGIIHRDIKPSNIMLDKRGRVKVADFGLAKTVNLESTLMTRSNVAMGTPDFIAPEALIPGMQMDGRADIYAVGVMLYQMLTGSIPRGRFELPSGVVQQVDRAFDAIVDKAMQTDREKRYSTATEMKTAVEKIAAPAPVAAPARAWSGLGDALTDHRLATAATKNRKPLLLGIAAAAVIVSTAAFFLTRGPPPSGPHSPLSGTSVATAPGTAQSALPAERWVNALTLETKLAHQPADLTPEGLRFVGNRFIQNERAPKRDGALRMQTGFVPGTQGPQLRVRNAAHDTQSYSLNIDSDGRAAVLRRLAKAAGGASKLGEFPLPKPLSAGEDYELELRAVGSQFTVKFNGQALGEADDAAIAEGQFGIATSIITEPVLVKSVEYLNLDTGTLSSSPNLPVTAPSTKFPPGQWVKLFTKAEDLPEELRKPDSGVKWEDGWLRFGVKPVRSIDLPAELQKNYAIRCRFKRDPATGHSAGLILRSGTDGGGQPGFYSFDLTPKQELLIKRKQSGPQGDSYPTISTTKATDAELTKPEEVIEFGVMGDHLVARLGMSFVKLVIDPHLRHGKGYIAGGGASAVRDIEVINLDGLPEAEALRLLGVDEKGNDLRAASKTGALGPSALPAALEARAIKLWDAPEKIPTSAKLRWEDQAVRVDGQPLREKTGVRDLILRASVRLNPTAQIPQLHARVQSTSEGGTTDAHYSLSISGDAQSVMLNAIIGGKRKDLQTWPLPRPPGSDPWLRLELNIIGDALTVSADGQVLGTVRDTSVPAAGDMVIFADAGGYFRDISYIPLDGLSEAEARQVAGMEAVSASPNHASSKSSRLPPGQWTKVFTTFEELRAAAPDQKAFAWKDGWIDGTASATGPRATVPGSKVRNGGIRLHGKIAEGIRGPFAINVSIRRADGKGSLSYQFILRGMEAKPSAALSYYDDATQKGEELSYIQADPTPKPGDEFDLELIAIGDKLYGKFNGKALPVVTDARLTEGEMGFQTKHLARDIEVINLDGLSEAEARKVAGIDGRADGLPSAANVPAAALGGPSSLPAYPQPKQWVDVTEYLRGTHVANGALQADGEWLEAQKETFIGIVRGGGALQNLAVRVRFAHQVEVHLRKHTQSLDTFYMLRIGDRKASISLVQGSSPWRPLAAPVELKSDFDDGSEHELVATALGSQLSLWLDGTLLVSATDSTLTGGAEHQIRIKPKAGGPPTRIKQVEYGALEAAGLDGRANGPPSAAAPPKTGALVPSALPAPAAPLVNGTYPFTPGQWVKVFKKFEEIPASLREKSGLIWRDGLIDGSGAGTLEVVSPIGAGGQNRGIRIHGKLMPATGEAPVVCFVCVRRGFGAGTTSDYRLSISGSDFTTLRLAYAGKLPELASIRLDSPLKPGDEFDMELIAIGDKLYGKFNGKPLPAVTDARLTEGGIGFSTKHLIRDVEVINLDDLSEAEARKVAGVEAPDAVK